MPARWFVDPVVLPHCRRENPLRRFAPSPANGGNGAAGIALFRSRALILVGGMCWREVCGFGGKEKRDPRYPGFCRVSPRGWPSIST